MSDKHIIITTINHPTKAVKKLSKIKDHKLIVIGDYKTPSNWKLKNTLFISLNEQKKFGKLSNLIPKNHYCRKNLGYLESIQKKPEKIIDTDDDNIPKNNWEYPRDFFSKKIITTNNTHINVYKYFSNENIWPRGLPIEFINKNHKIKIEQFNKKIAIWQGLADKEPDLDAIFRLVNPNKKKIYFKKKSIIAIKKNVFTQINSQNTIFNKKFYQLLFLPCTVSFRFTDILRGYVAQPIIWSLDHLVGYFNANVYQDRNIHNTKSDFISEIEMYKNVNNFELKLKDIIIKKKDIADKMIDSYKFLINKKICKKNELKILDEWLNYF